jgi:hypothetical protein
MARVPLSSLPKKIKAKEPPREGGPTMRLPLLLFVVALFSCATLVAYGAIVHN